MKPRLKLASMQCSRGYTRSCKVLRTKLWVRKTYRRKIHGSEDSQRQALFLVALVICLQLSSGSCDPAALKKSQPS
jgi:hypothetical protein